MIWDTSFFFEEKPFFLYQMEISFMTTRCYGLRDDQGQRIGQLSPTGREPTAWLPRVIASLSRQCSTVIGNAFLGAICPNALATFAWFTLVTCVDKRGVWQQIFEVPVAQHSAFAKKVIAPRMYRFLPRRSNDQNPCNLWCPLQSNGFSCQPWSSPWPTGVQTCCWKPFWIRSRALMADIAYAKKQGCWIAWRGTRW